MSVKVFRAYPESGLEGTLSIPVCGYQRYYRCNAFGLYIYLWGFFSMVHLLSGDGHKEISFHFFWENDHHHPFYEYFFGSDYI